MFDNNPTGRNAPDKLAPHSADAEEAFLGSIIIAPHLIAAFVGVIAPQDFFVIRNSWVWAALLAIYHRGEDVDYVTIVEELRAREQLEQIGGAAYITYLANNTPTHIHADTYQGIVERASFRRQLLDAATKIGQIAMQEGAEIDETIAAAESQLFAVTRKRNKRNRPVPLSESASANFDATEKRYKAGDRGIAGLPTGFDNADVMLGGLLAGLYIVLGRSKMGKTALMLSMMLYQARWLLNEGREGRILYITYEETIEQLTQRLEIMTSGLESQKVRLAAFNGDGSDWDKYTGAHVELSSLPIDFLDFRGKSDSEIATALDMYTQENVLAAVYVDYLQRVTGTRTGKHGYGADRRHIEIKDVSYSLADTASYHNVPIIAAAQAKQEVVHRGDRLPADTDVQESDGALQACTGLISFYRESVYDDKIDPGIAHMAIRANRNGPVGTLAPGSVRWIGEQRMYVNGRR